MCIMHENYKENTNNSFGSYQIANVALIPCYLNPYSINSWWKEAILFHSPTQIIKELKVFRD